MNLNLATLSSIFLVCLASLPGTVQASQGQPLIPELKAFIDALPPFETDANGDPTDPALNEALDLLKCTDEAEGAPSPTRYDKLKDLLANGKLKKIPYFYENTGGLTYGGQIAIRTETKFGSLGTVKPMSGANNATSLTHELEHHESAESAGTYGDPDTHPDTDGEAKAIENHALMHLDSIDFLCRVIDHWNECGDGGPPPCDVIGQELRTAYILRMDIEKIPGNEYFPFTFLLRYFQDYYSVANGTNGLCGCSREDLGPIF
jgi:hypothetical protein